MSTFTCTRNTILLLIMTIGPALGADQSGSVNLRANSLWNLDTGAVTASGGDLLCRGTYLIPQGRAATYNLGKYGARIFKAIRSKDAAGAPYRALPIAAETLVTGDVFGVHTNGGLYAKVMVTALNGTVLSLQYT